MISKTNIKKCFVWSVVLNGTETWKLRLEDETRLKALEIWVCRGIKRITWMDGVNNEEVLTRIEEKGRF